MMKIQSLNGVLIQKTSLLIIAITLVIGLFFQQQQTLTFVGLGESSLVISASPFLKSALADHGQEITLKLHNSSFGSLTSGGGNQVSVFVNYQLNENSIAGQTINAVMEVYAPNGTLIRTSSYPNGFIVQSSGGAEGLETTIRDPTIQSVTANVTFRNLDKTAILSNDLRINLDLAQEGTAPTTTTGEGIGVKEEESTPQPTDHEESGLGNENEEQDEGHQLPLPLFGGG
jgi:hypothetical protein